MSVTNTWYSLPLRLSVAIALAFHFHKTSKHTFPVGISWPLTTSHRPDTLQPWLYANHLLACLYFTPRVGWGWWWGGVKWDYFREKLYGTTRQWKNVNNRPTCSRFGTIQECDRQTDGRTDTVLYQCRICIHGWMQKCNKNCLICTEQTRMGVVCHWSVPRWNRFSSTIWPWPFIAVFVNKQRCSRSCCLLVRRRPSVYDHRSVRRHITFVIRGFAFSGPTAIMSYGLTAWNLPSSTVAIWHVWKWAT